MIVNGLDLKWFSGGDERHDKPWKHSDGRIVATNGHILIMLDGKLAPEFEGVNPNPPDIEKAILSLLPKESQPLDLGDIKGVLDNDGQYRELMAMEEKTCPECMGGKVKCTCDTCGDEHDRKCPECAGAGVVGDVADKNREAAEMLQHVMLHKRKFAVRYLHLVRLAMEAFPGPWEVGMGKKFDAPNCFRADGVLIVLMGCR